MNGAGCGDGQREAVAAEAAEEAGKGSGVLAGAGSQREARHWVRIGRGQKDRCSLGSWTGAGPPEEAGS